MYIFRIQKHINRPQIAPFIRQSTHIDFLNHFDNIQVQNEKDTDFNVSKTGLIDKSKLYSFEKKIKLGRSQDRHMYLMFTCTSI